MSDKQECPRAQARQTAVTLQHQIWALSAAVMRISTIEGLPAADRDMWRYIFFYINECYDKVSGAEFLLGRGCVKCVSESFGLKECYELLEHLGMVKAQNHVSQASDLSFETYRPLVLARTDVNAGVARLITDLHRIQALQDPQPALAA
ncbi:hypothetical protein ASF24_15200 [Methylobacterium sp. Leaf86]|uniref:hypothetical protein n=1 Tax=Methylobacterium sp. Leaf86 TaxID=1736242 RepID=UPI0006F7E25A|nr:hypothetical protein [Methylobacterium sp. Leaf86]KQO57993.1 hypothetical protein ASF24_15200 [Methylobacterium sp. Leaf86]